MSKNLMDNFSGWFHFNYFFKWEKMQPPKKTMGPWARFWTHLTDLEHGLMGLKPQPLGIHFLSKAIEIATFFSLKILPKEAWTAQLPAGVSRFQNFGCWRGARSSVGSYTALRSWYLFHVCIDEALTWSVRGANNAGEDVFP